MSKMAGKILFVELLGGLGDVVIALPAIHALALSNPMAEVTVVTLAPGADLLRADPLVRRVCLAERGSPANPDLPRRALEALLAQEHFDLIVSDTTYAGIADLLETSGARVVSNLWRNPPPDQRIEERFLHILVDEGLIPPWARTMRPHLSLDLGARLWAALQFTRPERRVLLHPHAGMPIKAWPEERLVALGQALYDRHALQAMIPEGVGAEASMARRVAAAVGHGASVLRAGSLPQLAAAAVYADLAIGADTGPLRIAAAVGVPTITLFGPSWHGRYGERPPHVNLQGYPECPRRIAADFTRQDCWWAGRCPLRAWQTCLEDITVADVVGAAHSLLGLTSWWGRTLPQHAFAGVIS